MKILIPMAGKSRRFRKSGYKLPKYLLKIRNREMIHHVCEMFDKKDEFYFLCSKDQIKNYNLENTFNEIFEGFNFSIIPVDDHDIGPIQTIQKSLKNLRVKDTEPVIISYCDFSVDWNYKNFLKNIDISDPDGSVVSYTGFHPHMLGKDEYGFLKTDGSNRVLDIQEKKSFTNNRMAEHASAGLYYFKSFDLMKKYFDYIIENDIKVNEEHYVSLAYKPMIDDGLKIESYLADKMCQWGTPSDLENYLKWSDYFESISSNNENYFSSKNKDITLIFPMAGAGSRYRKHGHLVPKPLINVAKEEMFVEAFKCLPKFSKNKFICLKDHLENFPIEECLKRNYNKNEYTITSLEKITQGQACTCEVAIKEPDVDLEKPIIITACDNGISYDIDKFNQLVNDNSNDVIVFSFRKDDTSKNKPEMYSWLSVDDNLDLKKVYVKNCPMEDPFNNHCIIGTMYFRKAKYFLEGLNEIYKKDIKTNNEYYVDNLLNPLVEKGYNVKVFEVKKYVCWGTHEDLKTYRYWEDHFGNMFKDRL